MKGKAIEAEKKDNCNYDTTEALHKIVCTQTMVLDLCRSGGHRNCAKLISFPISNPLKVISLRFW